MNRPRIRPRLHARPFRRGLGLVELMVSLAIAAALLTATAAALDATIQAYQINVQQAMVLQGERVAMNRILSTIRRSRLHAPEDATLSAQFAAGGKVTGSAIAMFDVNGTPISFRYDAANKALNMVSGTTTHPLLYGVESFAITMEPMRSSASVKVGGGWDLLYRATFVMTVASTSQTSTGPEAIGSVRLTLSASVMPRRNSW